MLDTAHLEVDRQINVGNALGPILAALRPTPLQSTTVTRGDAVIAATLALLNARGTPPKLVDQATDSVVTAFDRTLDTREQMLRDTLVPLGPQQLEALGRLRFLRARLFPTGTTFIRLPMELEWRHLTELKTHLEDDEVVAAIEALGLQPEVEHVSAHLERYGRALGQDGGGAGRATELASTAWHEAFRRFAAQVLADYGDDLATQRELLGPYEAQLVQQRVLARAQRRARAAEAAGAGGGKDEGGKDEEHGPPSKLGSAAPAAG
ncbi:hypothetical protein [Chondromyces apiculatus]|uniref:Uncharacterized protein n=1 Tax=Chondromyces apiculatus DSM 436 TaxID=1192034 RepID=A0A017TI76_9BACT|nr:hypothetical protein [Chondromyces apiculatus]EYF08562.1 Hypothetical protein CAP_4092 [Chondromyces apiculatus DSM 436]